MRLRRSILLGLCTPLAVACSRPSASPSPVAAASVAAPAVDPARKALLATLPARYQGADLYNGQAKFALCRSCHTATRGAPATIGPNLWGVFGRRAGRSRGFAYSSGLKALNVTWDADTIDAWIANPRAMVPGTKMTYVGLENPEDRIDVIAYLKTVTTAR